MIAACPRCAARYRVDPERIGPQGSRLRCAKCEAVFRVRAPEAVTPPPAVAEITPTPSAPPPVQETPAPPKLRTPDPNELRISGEAPVVDRDLLVLVADSDVEGGKETASAVASWGLQPILVHDGVEAMLTIQRMRPRAVVLDAALPKMFGFQICEVVKRNEALRDTHVVLIGAIHHRDRYRRPPEELYGADVYVERPDLPEGLAQVLRRLGLALKMQGEGETPVPAAAPTPIPIAMDPPSFAETPTPVPTRVPVERLTSEPTPVQVPPPAPVAAPSTSQTESPTHAPVADGLDDERAKAERLARIIVSDIVLYNPDRFDEAVKSGDVVAMLDPALEEGRELFRQRIDERVRDERDYLEAELRRVASQRDA